MNSVDPSSNFVVRRGVGGRVGDDRNENEYYERFQLNQYYNAVEDEQIYMDEYTGLLHRYNEFITNGNAMFSRMEQTLRENLSRTLVRQSFYYNSSGMRARASSDTPAVTAPVAAPVAAAPTVADVFPRLLSRYLNNELSREARQPTQPTQPTQPNNNIFSMLYTIPLEVRRNANQVGGVGGGGGSAATNEQVHRATMNTTFGNVLSPVNATCPISRDEFNDESEITMIRGCNHIFNRTSLREWFVNHSTCPMCRGDIREYRPPATSPAAAPLPEQRRQPQPPQRQNPPANLSIDRIDNNEFTFSYDLPVNYNNDQIYQDIVNTVNDMTNIMRRSNNHSGSGGGGGGGGGGDDDIMEVD